MKKKTNKKARRLLALLLALAVCLGCAIPATAETSQDHGTVLSLDDVPGGSDYYQGGDVVSEPETTPAPVPTTPAPAESLPGSQQETESPSAEADLELARLLETEGAEIPVSRDQKVSAPVRKGPMKAPAAGTSGTLRIGYNTFSSFVGDMPSFGGDIATLPSKTLISGGTYYAAYCLDEKLAANGGHGYSSVDLKTVLGETKASLIGDILAQGYQYQGSSGIPQGEGYKWAITQIMIWQAQYGSIYRDTSTGLNVFKQTVIDDVAKCASASGHYTDYYTYFYTLKASLENLRKIPSFAGTTAQSARNKANSIPVSEDGSVFTKSFPDLNGVLQDFPNFPISDSRITLTKSGNTMTATATEELSSPVVSGKSERTVRGGAESVVGWSPSVAGDQRFLTCDPANDPVPAYVSFTTSGELQENTGAIEITKTSEDGIVSGISFTISGSDGSTYTYTTDASGHILATDLPVEANGSQITYTVRENTPVRYVVPSPQTVVLAAEETASLHFENRLKKWRLIFSKLDAETGRRAQGDATLGGATYGVYKNGVLQKAYTTDTNGKIITDYYPYGDGYDRYTWREISPSTGYLLDTKVYLITDGGLSEISQEYNENGIRSSVSDSAFAVADMSMTIAQRMAATMIGTLQNHAALEIRKEAADRPTLVECDQKFAAIYDKVDQADVTILGPVTLSNDQTLTAWKITPLDEKGGVLKPDQRLIVEAQCKAGRFFGIQNEDGDILFAGPENINDEDISFDILDVVGMEYEPGKLYFPADVNTDSFFLHYSDGYFLNGDPAHFMTPVDVQTA